MPKTELDQRCINALRVLAMDGVQKANSGHPGMPMEHGRRGLYPLDTPSQTQSTQPQMAQPRSVHSVCGSRLLLLYSLLCTTGYPISMEDLKQFRQWGSKTAGHPEYDADRGIETTTGPLGQGFGNGVRMAIAARHMAARFNRQGFLFDHWVYAIVSDGDLEGVSQEAASLAGHLGLDRIIYFYDQNGISIEGSTDLAFTEDVPARFQANGWHVQTVAGHDTDAIDSAIRVQRRPPREAASSRVEPTLRSAAPAFTTAPKLIWGASG